MLELELLRIVEIQLKFVNQMHSSEIHFENCRKELGLQHIVEIQMKHFASQRRTIETRFETHFVLHFENCK
jgi:hypothetical protein